MRLPCSKKGISELCKSQETFLQTGSQGNKEHGIRLSGPKLGRPNAETQKTDKKQEYQDNTDRIEVERRFSLAKHCYGLGMIRTKLKETQLTSIALSVFVANLFRKMQRILFVLLFCFKFYPMENGWLTA